MSSISGCCCIPRGKCQELFHVNQKPTDLCYDIFISMDVGGLAMLKTKAMLSVTNKTQNTWCQNLSKQDTGRCLNSI